MNFSVSYCGFLSLLLAQHINANSECSDVHVVFARGSTELPGLGICGEPFVSSLTSNLNGFSVSSYAVDYEASATQLSAGPGATDMTNHVVVVANQCPSTVFVMGGYSQGASVTDIAIGIDTVLGQGETIPEALAPRIKAVVTFGNPLFLFGETIESSSQLYRSKVVEFCEDGDPVCGNGINPLAHIMYPSDGSVTSAAEKAAALVNKLLNCAGPKLGLLTEVIVNVMLCEFSNGAMLT
ncbi:putative cutinase cut3 [Phytophthora citrophthora]|uniref:Cutinase cut3 n=1 Tax=Phytophthora citrophthora TaxID=4793 RepID=A0AAD9GRN2_9STRA|nr:putative cutinase cut3 [Phytophthora citrophthora]